MDKSSGRHGQVKFRQATDKSSQCGQVASRPGKDKSRQGQARRRKPRGGRGHTSKMAWAVSVSPSCTPLACSSLSR